VFVHGPPATEKPLSTYLVALVTPQECEAARRELGNGAPLQSSPDQLITTVAPILSGVDLP